MKILAFDTSTGNTSVAISEDQNILAYTEDNSVSAQAERLVPMIEETLKHAKLSYNQVDCLSVINGPGSFTGIRIALATAQGIIAGADITGYAVTNFEIAAYRARLQVQEADNIIVYLDAYRNQLYVQVFEQNGSVAQDPELINISDAAKVMDYLKGEIICTGDRIPLVYDQLKTSAQVTILPRFSRIRAFHICRFTALAIRNSLPLGLIEPLYIRLPDAVAKQFHK